MHGKRSRGRPITSWPQRLREWFQYNTARNHSVQPRTKDMIYSHDDFQPWTEEEHNEEEEEEVGNNIVETRSRTESTRARRQLQTRNVNVRYLPTTGYTCFRCLVIRVRDEFHSDGRGFSLVGSRRNRRGLHSLRRRPPHRLRATTWTQAAKFDQKKKKKTLDEFHACTSARKLPE